MSRQSGSALVMSLFVMGILSVLIGGFLLIITSDLNVARYDALGRQTRYVAEAGIMEAIYQLTVNPDWNAGYTDFELISGQKYTVTVTNTNPTVNVVSLGEVDTLKSTVQSQLTIVRQRPSGRYHVRVDSWELL